MTNHYDRIAASAPVNAQAAKVTGRGEGWTPAVSLQDWYPDQPPTKKAAPNPGNPEWRDLTGMKVGNLTVLGVLIRESEKAPTSWVCRCVCGCFTTRKTKSLKIGIAGGNSFVGVCGRCFYQQRLRTGWTPELKNRPKVKA